MKSGTRGALLLLACALVLFAGIAQAQESKLVISGTTYTKWLWGDRQVDGSVYNFTTVPGEGYGDNGQGSEVELLLSAKVSKSVEVKGRLHSRFNQNQWTNYGGFGGTNDASVPAIGGDHGEFDPRSNQYIKLRGVTVFLTPGYRWIDAATIGANDFGMFDPFTIGKIRYIDRDNAAGLLFQGSAVQKNLRWDATRISLPRLWAGPNWSTGNYTGADAAYGLQAKYDVTQQVNVGGVFEYVNDIEVNPDDHNIDNGVKVNNRFRNNVYGLKAGVRPIPWADVSGAWYYSYSYVSDRYAPGYGSFGLGGFSSVPGGKLQDASFKVDASASDPLGVGLSLDVQGFDIGSRYVSMMAARRESDVLLTEGHDGAWAFPGPDNAAYGIYGGNPSRIGYGGWDGNAQQVATINVDNEFTDFDEPMAETVIGWKGFTVVPKFGVGGLDLQGEFTHIGYNTNWQAWGNPTGDITKTVYPSMELDSGVGHNFRSAYAPFQDKKTNLAVLNAKYTVMAGKGIDLTGKVKYIKETDNRLNDWNFIPYNKDGSVHYYSGTFTTSSIYPRAGTFGGSSDGNWKTFDDIADDDRDLKYTMFNLGAGYQLTSDLYGGLGFTRYDADLKDGNTAFRANGAHEMASGKHKKNQLIAKFKYILSGTEIGLEYQYNHGTFTPDFGTGYTPQTATQDIANAHNVPVGSKGVLSQYGSWNSLEERTFTQQRIKAFMKVQF